MLPVNGELNRENVTVGVDVIFFFFFLIITCAGFNAIK